MTIENLGFADPEDYKLKIPRFKAQQHDGPRKTIPLNGVYQKVDNGDWVVEDERGLVVVYPDHAFKKKFEKVPGRKPTK